MRADKRARFDNYIVGSANLLAVAAAHAVADAPGAVYNPLFIYSSAGLGKTHLTHAIGNQAMARHPDMAIEYVPLEDFVEQLHAAIATGEMDRFKQRYGRVDVLLIDDVDERLIQKLSGGLIVDIGVPDYETRVAILRAKCEEKGVSFEPGVIEELARVEFSNV